MAVTGNGGFVQPVYSLKNRLIGHDAQVMGKLHNAATAIAAHGALVAIAVEIHHFKIAAAVVLQQDQAIGTDAKPAVAELGYGVGRHRKAFVPVIDHDKIVTRAVVFVKGELHAHQICAKYVKFKKKTAGNCKNHTVTRV